MSFERALEVVLSEEGGYVNNPADPGGETNFGISKRAYPDLDIKNVSRETAASIYRQDYWLATRCDQLPPGLDLMVFDAAVNMGPKMAIRLLQGAVGAQVDGVMGVDTLAKARLCTGFLAARTAIKRMAVRRVFAYFSLGKFDTFGKGWISRVFHVYEVSLALAKGD